MAATGPPRRAFGKGTILQDDLKDALQDPLANKPGVDKPKSAVVALPKQGKPQLVAQTSEEGVKPEKIDAALEKVDVQELTPRAPGSR